MRARHQRPEPKLGLELRLPVNLDSNGCDEQFDIARFSEYQEPQGFHLRTLYHVGP